MDGGGSTLASMGWLASPERVRRETDSEQKYPPIWEPDCGCTYRSEIKQECALLRGRYLSAESPGGRVEHDSFSPGTQICINVQYSAGVGCVASEVLGLYLGFCGPYADVAKTLPISMGLFRIQSHIASFLSQAR